MEEELIKVNINIAGRSYPIKVTATEQLMITGIEKDLNRTIQSLQQNYPKMDLQDCLSMAMIKLAFESKNGPKSQSVKKASQIQELLSSAELS